MLIAVCPDCGLRSYPAHFICGQCRQTEVDWVEIKDVTVVQATRPPGASDAIATVTAERGPRMIARVPGNALPGDVLTVVDVETPCRAFVPPDPRAPCG